MVSIFLLEIGLIELVNWGSD
uniref:Uncharacterized protein n=1 Tax=Rhizophora mucronata TaxID=61149 RepID=A0A2P2MEI7_RHIMU